MKRWWQVWLLTWWGRWLCVRFYGADSAAKFTSKKNALDYLKNGGFSYKKFQVLPQGERPRRSR